MQIKTLIKNNVYFDSMVLMRLSSLILEQPGVQKAQVMMGTDVNRRTIKDQELLTPEVLAATPNDLFIVVAAEDPESAGASIAHALDYLDNRQESKSSSVQAYKSLDGAISSRPEANLVAISLPGKYATAEAKRALNAGKHVFLFSDNVPIEEEIELKQLAHRQKRIVMGPDCGTAILGGAALGFANAVRRGPIGVVGASGTGIQEVTTLIHRLGSGISHAIGTGGRDVKEAVGGDTLVAGLQWLQADPATEVILMISKPPEKAVSRKVLQLLRENNKPVVVNLLGSTDRDLASNLTYYAETMEEAARLAVRLSGVSGVPLYDENILIQEALAERAKLAPSQKYYRGLFSGGTFANEAALLLSTALDDVYGNISMPNILPLNDPFASTRHSIVDMGEDVFTVGKPHPILAPELRRARLLTEAADPQTAVIFLDIVLGYGSHPDPAADFAGYIDEAQQLARSQGRHVPVVVYLAGVEEDPQQYSKQISTLQKTGALIAPTNAAATRIARTILTGEPALAPVVEDHPRASVPSRGSAELPFELPHKANVINIGLQVFGDSLQSQGIETTFVDFSPPAGGNEDLAEILESLL